MMMAGTYMVAEEIEGVALKSILKVVATGLSDGLNVAYEVKKTDLLSKMLFRYYHCFMKLFFILPLFITDISHFFFLYFMSSLL